jgi:hypothetical protein
MKILQDILELNALIWQMQGFDLDASDSGPCSHKKNGPCSHTATNSLLWVPDIIICVCLDFFLPLLFWYTWTSGTSPCLHFGRYYHSDSTINFTFVLFLGSIRNIEPFWYLGCTCCVSRRWFALLTQALPHLHLFSAMLSWWQRDRQLYTRALCLWGSSSTSSR